MRHFLLLLYLLSGLSVKSQPDEVMLSLCETKVPVGLFRSGEPQLLFLALHDDEGTSEVIESILKDSAGLFIRVRNHHQRMILYQCKGQKKGMIDPNRIFGETSASAYIDSFAAGLLALLPDSLLLVSVHTNQEGGFSVLSYAEKKSSLSDSLWLQPGSDPDHFILVTEPKAYAFFKTQGVHTVLQRKGATPDDGSLSLWADRHGRELITVEAQHGHPEKLRDMLLSVYRFALWRSQE